MKIDQSGQGGLVIAGGGTGGHIYPAIAIAQAIRTRFPNTRIDFVGTQKGLESKIVPRENFPLHFIDVGALNSVGMFTKLFTLLKLPLAIIQSMSLLWRLKPRAVLGVGGYASGPIMLAALLLRPILKFEVGVWEPNAYPGLTNRWVAKVVQKSFVNFESSIGFFNNPEVVGIPIRSGLKPLVREQHSDLRILVFGGSQGARGINQTVSEAIRRGGDWLKDVRIVHQIGSREFEGYKVLYDKIKPEGVEWFEFLYDMPDRYAWADVVFCRAGASTLAELAACQKASVLIPFPHAADNHQQMNAEALVKESAAEIILQKDFTPEKFIEKVLEFKNHPEKIMTLENKVKSFYRARSAERIAISLVAQEAQS